MIAVLAALLLSGETAAPAEAAAPQATESVIANPLWKSRASAEDMAKFYPSAAEGGVSRVVVLCRVGKHGWLDNCKVESVDPARVGFEEAGLKAARKFQMAPTDKDGAPTAGRTARLPLVWSVPPKPR